eukprot:142311-Prymnesium_polylepis.1
MHPTNGLRHEPSFTLAPRSNCARIESIHPNTTAVTGTEGRNLLAPALCGVGPTSYVRKAAPYSIASLQGSEGLRHHRNNAQKI